MVHEAEDGGVTVLGTPTGQPFRSRGAANRLEERLLSEEEGAEGRIYALPLSTSEEWS